MARRVIIWGAGLGIVGILGAIALVFSGLIPTSARPPHMEITRIGLHTVFRNSVRHGASRTAPDVPADMDAPGRIALGAQHYAQVCSSCHGGPGLGQSPQALGMRPSPQYLAAVVDQFEDQELFVILRDGVRFSGMAAWPADDNYAEIWHVVAFLRAMEGMTAEDYRIITEPPQAAPANVPETPWVARGSSAPYSIHSHPNPPEEYNPTSPGTGWRQVGMDNVPLSYCAACHGIDGGAGPTQGYAPSLSIHTEQFIADRLHDYASGARPSGIMANVANALSDTQIDALAAYFAGQEASDEPAGWTLPEGADLARGEAIALGGVPEASVPACGQCHSATATQTTLALPHLAGQSASFLMHRLDSFANAGEPAATGWNPMYEYAARLSEDDRRDVAAYLASLSATDPLTPLPIGGEPVAPDLARETLPTACETCHGTEFAGGGNELAPNLTLQEAPYIFQQLMLFSQEVRYSTVMASQAHALTQTEMEDLAAYIGAQDPLPTQANGPDEVAELIAAGEQIAINGLPDRGVPSCLSCHASEALDSLPMLPRLHGQNPLYLEHRLESFGHPFRPDGQDLGTLTQVFEALSEQEIQEVSAYFGSLEALQQ